MWFQVDKEASLDVMRGLLAQLKEENEALFNEGNSVDNFYCKGDYDRKIVGAHKLRLVEVFTWCKAIDGAKIREENFQRALEEKLFNISDAIEIYSQSEVVNDKIVLDGYFHDSEFACDSCCLEFTYDPRRQTWLIDDLEHDGDIQILDFSAYFLPPDKVPKIEEGGGRFGE